MDRAMDLIEKIRQKYRDGQLTEAVVEKVKAVLIRRLHQVLKLTPFILYQEGISRDDWQSTANDFNQYEIGFLDYEDIKEIAAIEPHYEWLTIEKLSAGLKNGEKFFGAKYRGKIVSFSWARFESSDDPFYRFPLRENEVYFWYSYTVSSFRGKGIAPYLRRKFYNELHKLGRDTFHSITHCSNKPAVRFKEKLNAKPLKLFIRIRLLKKWSWSWKIKNYRYDMD